MELIDEILSKENLNEAYLQVFRNKGSAGIDGITVDELKDYLKQHGETIIKDIKTRKYRPTPVKLGIDSEQAKGLTWCRRGYQYISHSWIIQRAISNIRLEKRGLVNARDHYLKVHTVI